MVDLTRDEHGCLHARLLDAVQSRSGKAYADWLEEQGLEVTVTVEHAALDPFRGYANAIRDQLPDATTVLDAFHVVKLAGNALDEVRRRVQQQTLSRRGQRHREGGRKVRPEPEGTSSVLKRSEHGLGHLLNPVQPDHVEDRDWIDELLDRSYSRTRQDCPFPGRTG